MLVRVPLLLFSKFSLVRVGRPAIERIAIATTASGVVVGGVGGVARGVAVGDAIDESVDNAALVLFVLSRVTGAGTIDVAHAAAAGRVL